VVSMSNLSGGSEPAELRGDAWLRPATEDNDLRRYLTTLRERRLLILACTVIAALVALVYVEVATPVYQAESDVLILPSNVSGNVTLAGLPLIQASSDPTRDIQTAARLITTPDVAADVKTNLGLHETPQQILTKVSSTPVAQSDIVAVTANASSPGGAARLANAFVTSAIARRTLAFQRQIDRQMALLTERMNAASSIHGISDRLAAGLSQLQTLRSGPLPDMGVATTAQPPTNRSSPRKALSVIVGIVSGLLIGLIAAFALDGLDPRVHREEQLRRLFRLPILARIPRVGTALGGVLAQRWRYRKSTPRSPASLNPPALEAYRTLRATLLALRPASSRSILVTGASQSEGKTTTAINLAVSLAWSGASVILIDADLRLPAVGRALGVTSEFDLSHVLRGQVSLEQALVQTHEYEGLRILLADHGGGPGTFVGDELLLPAASSLLADAQSMADYVVIDSPPLAEVVDALELARRVDDVLLVVRLGQTKAARLRRLGALLARTGVHPVGIVLVGTEPPRGSERYPYVGGGPRGQSTTSGMRVTAR
jgi:capsular exopolysaccharide synthesis family protein